MKYLVQFIIGITLLQCSCTNTVVEAQDQQEYCDCRNLNLDADYNHFYLKDRTKPYTGNCIQKNDNNIVVLEKNFLNGKLHGEMKTFYDNGKLKELSHYDLNFIDGIYQVYDELGNILIEKKYQRGVEVKVK